MSMSIAAPQPGSDGWYSSNGAASRRWWMQWNKRPGAEVLWSVVSIPLGVALVWYLCGVDEAHVRAAHSAFVMTPERWKALRVISAAFVVWVSTLYLCRRVHQSHAKHALQLRATDAGLDIRAPFVKKTINWTKVRRVFANNALEYMICTTEGSYYFPADQPWSRDLFDQIHNYAALSEVNYLSAMHTDSHYRLTWCVLQFSVVVCIVFQYIKLFINGTPTSFAYLSAVTLFALPILLFTFGTLYLVTVKVPDVFRVAEKEIYILDLDGEHVIAKDSVRHVRKIGNFVVVSTQDQSWIVQSSLLFDPTNPLISGKKIALKEQKKISKAATKALLLQIKPDSKNLTHSKI